ncbi:MAG: ABC transporter substrate-binding protein [Pseudomonadota bacterium]
MLFSSRHIRPTRIYVALVAAAVASFAVALPVTAQDGAGASAVAGATKETSEAQEKAQKISDAVAFTEMLTERATAALTAADKTEAEKLTDFQGVLREGLALDYIGRIIIGDARKTMSAEQTARYEAVFPEYITRYYADQFADIVGRPLVVIDSRIVRRDVIVRTQFSRSEGEPISVDWRVRELKSGDQKVIDIIASGISIMIVKREEFSAYVAANGVDALLALLEEQAGVTTG